MANPLVVPPADLTQRVPAGADAGHAPAVADKTPAGENVTLATTSVGGATASENTPAARGPYAGLHETVRDALNGTADCIQATASAPTAASNADLPNTPLSPYDRMRADPNSGKNGWYVGLKLEVPFSTGPRGVTVGTPQASPTLATTGKGAATACLVTGAVGAAINQAVRVLPGQAGNVIRAAQYQVQRP